LKSFKRGIDITIADLERRKKQGRFETDESKRLLWVGILFDKAIDVLGGESRPPESG
jgi:uncharacterized protein (DUF2384 family)